VSTDRARYDAASSLARQGRRPRQASSMPCVPTLKGLPVKDSIRPARITPGRRQQLCVPRQRPHAEHRREVLTGLALRDMPLRISVAVTGLLLAARVPLPGFAPTGPYAAFHTTSARLQPAGPRHECTAGGPA
jgi:hypothetical protein